MKVSPVGFGCWQMGGYYWGAVEEKELVRAVHRALDLGINFFDTADFYGFGRSEEILAKALGKRRSEAVICTKVGIVTKEGKRDFDPDDLLLLESSIEKDLTADHVVKAAEESLKRLRTDRIDLYLMHWPDPRTPLEETMEAMERLVHAGKVRAVGCSNFSIEEMRKAHSFFPLAAHELKYNLLDREAETALIPACAERGISVIAYWALAKGLLSGKFSEQTTFAADDWRHHDPQFSGEQFRKRLAAAAQLKRLADEAGITLGQLAIAWVLSRDGVSSTIIGTKRPEQIEENAKAAGASLSPSLLEEIKGAVEKLAP